MGSCLPNMLLVHLLSLVPLITGLHDGNERGFCDSRSLPKMADVSVRDKVPMSMTKPRNNDPTPDLIKAAGYPAETHYVTTQDGYILAMHRIPHGRAKGSEEKRPVIFVQHGLLCSSSDWVIATPSKGLGYILADAGYDVWLGNYRGNTYSRNHTFLNPENQRGGFWDFTWDEMAHYDLPAMIEKVLEVTGKTELFYAGHSMGTTAFMAMHHYRPDIGEKVRLANFLAPVASEANMGGPPGWIAGLGIDGMMDVILSMMGVGEFLPSNLLIDCLATLFCHETVTQGLCTNILFIICGFDEAQMNTTLLPTLLHHTPAGASTHTILHYAQEKPSGGFHGYDWGSDKENFQHHGGPVPEYNLADVKTPVALYWSDNDYFAMPGDILQTIIGLPNIVPGMNHEVEFELWTHLDFLWGIDADKYVYSYMMSNLQTCRETDCRK